MGEVVDEGAPDPFAGSPVPVAEMAEIFCEAEMAEAGEVESRKRPRLRFQSSSLGIHKFSSPNTEPFQVNKNQILIAMPMLCWYYAWSCRLFRLGGNLTPFSWVYGLRPS